MLWNFALLRNQFFFNIKCQISSLYERKILKSFFSVFHATVIIPFESCMMSEFEKYFLRLSGLLFISETYSIRNIKFKTYTNYYSEKHVQNCVATHISLKWVPHGKLRRVAWGKLAGAFRVIVKIRSEKQGNRDNPNGKIHFPRSAILE